MTVSDWVDSQRTPETEPTGATVDGSSPTDGSAAPKGGTATPEGGTATPDDGRTANDTGRSSSSDQTREWGEWPSKPGEDGDSQSPQSSRTDDHRSSQADGHQSPRQQSNSSDHPIRARIEEDEDNSQKSARSDVVSPEELAAYRETDAEPSPSVSQTPSEASTPESHPARENPAAETSKPAVEDGTVIEPSSDERPSLDQLREELNDQFESIKILGPGQYELNLMELYDRDEYIISLKEDGRYVIEVPDTWGRNGRDD
jgi:predicted  nucleic acid-binding Zn-ribbon protein